MPRQPSAPAPFDDLSSSIPFDMERSLDDSFSTLLDWFVEALLATDRTQRRPSSTAKIREAFDCLLANLLDAYRRSRDCYLATSMEESTFTYHARYQQRRMG